MRTHLYRRLVRHTAGTGADFSLAKGAPQHGAEGTLATKTILVGLAEVQNLHSRQFLA